MTPSGMMFDLFANVTGGLFVFLLGMKYMSDGMQAVAGNRLRRMISAVTDNRFMACATGAFVTSLIQSSSVTTVMLVGMVNAGIMTLVQAFGVILGADIGTTITAWIVALKIVKYGLPIMGISGFCYLFARSEPVRNKAMGIMGIGMVFFGLELMKHGLDPVRDMPAFVAMFSRFSPATFVGLVKCVSAGALVTAVVQSSSATVAITITLAGSGIIGLDTAVALVLGQNIGTTITAFLASLGTSRNAKRVAYAHILMKIVGVLMLLPVFNIYMQMLNSFLPGHLDVAKQIAVAHTLFNCLLVALFLPLRSLVVKLLHYAVPDSEKAEVPHLTVLDVRLLDTPIFAIQQSAEEVIKMGATVSSMMRSLRTVVSALAGEAESEAETIFKGEKALDQVQKEVVGFITHLLAGNVSRDLMDETRRQLRMVDEYESISDYLASLLKLNLKLQKAHLSLSDVEQEAVFKMHDAVNDLILMLNRAVHDEDEAILTKMQTQGDLINRSMKQYRQEHLARMEETHIPPLKSVLYIDILQSYRKIKEHCQNIADVLAGEK